MMKDEHMGFTVYLLFQGLIALSIVGIVLDYLTGQRMIHTGMLAGVMVLTAVYLAFGIWYLWRRVFRPLRELETLAERWTELDDPVQAALSLPGMVGGVARAVEGRMEELDRKTAAMESSETERSEVHIRRGLLEDICRSTVPRMPGQPDGTPSFLLTGTLEAPGRGACCLYDCFLLQPELLCVMIGEVEGEEIADALFLAAAQTTLRNALRTQPSLEDAVNSANTQLYDFGKRRSFRVLVGVLDLKSGTFRYVNAGCPQPLVMRRSQERYTLLEFPSHDPMGLEQKVSYRAVDVRLRKGDRLFFGTSGLGRIKNQAGVVFSEQGLRTALKRSGKRASEFPQILSYVVEEAAAWIGSESPLPGFSALLLEYLRSRTDIPNCDLPAVPESVPEVTEFVRKQCRESGLQGRNYTLLSVMVEELFTLCCRYGNGVIRTECVVSPAGDAVNIRMSGDMGGRNPLEIPDDMTSENAAEFIFAHTDYTQFQSENGEDSITMVCFIE